MSDTGAKVCGNVESEAWSGSFAIADINTSDDTRAIHLGNVYAEAEISDFAFGIPPGSTIDGIEVFAEFSSNSVTKIAYIRLSLSYDDGIHWTATLEGSVTGNTDEVITFGNPFNDWGRSWSVSEFADGTFRIMVEGKTNSATNNCRLDLITAKVYYTPPSAESNSFFIMF